MANDIVMAFDFGLRKIGVAVGQSVTGTATPVAIVKATEGLPDWVHLDKLVEEWQPSRLVVGLPLNMDGTTSDMSVHAEKFGRRLNGRFHIEVKVMDERLTSREAREIANKGAGEVDDIAAKLILESYFRNNP